MHFCKLSSLFLHVDYQALNRMYNIGVKTAIFTLVLIYTFLLIHILCTKKLIRKYIVKRIIKNKELYCIYQPIVDLKTGLTYGYESLSRTNSCRYKNIKDFIDDVYELDLIEDFVLTTVKNAIDESKGLEKDNYLFVNIDTKLLTEKFHKLYNILKSLDIQLRKHLVLELTEYNLVEDMKKLQESVEKIRNLGVKVAIDDFGVGYSNIDIRMSIEVDFVKVDMQFIKDIDKLEKKKDLIKMILEFNRYTQTLTIAEGIETQAELDTLIQIGVSYGQGYYLGKPNKINRYIE